MECSQPNFHFISLDSSNNRTEWEMDGGVLYYNIFASSKEYFGNFSSFPSPLCTQFAT